MMRFRNLLREWLTSAGRGDSCNLLHSSERMRAILDRERLRSDRGNSTFSLLTLTLPRRSSTADLDTLARTVHDRIRATDDAGLMGPRCVGIILPETPVPGARKLADDLCDLLPPQMRRPQCDIYSYPSSGELAAEESMVDAGAVDPQENGRPMEVFFAQAMPLWKRAIDVLGAGTALVLAGPLMLLVAAAIKLTSPGPVIFKQRRDTIGGRQFTIYKFRTMTVDAEAKKAALLSLSEQDGPAFKIAKDPRITRLGRILRATSIDELPQLFNVLVGDMTLVGPRAMDSNESRRCELWQRRRLDVTAGLTCIWQVRGRSAVPFVEWMRMDLRYVETRTLAHDLKLIFQTVPAVLLRRGAC
jgi:lipopolysaccharide/colanic/teichoic acid biosynthesis glycosyltransferase